MCIRDSLLPQIETESAIVTNSDAFGCPRGHPERRPTTGQLTRGQRHRERDTPVHADEAADPWCGYRFGNHSERDMPTTRPLACDAVRLPPGQCPAGFEPDPADLRPPAHWTVHGCRGGPATPQARRSAGPHPRRPYATSDADGGCPARRGTSAAAR